MDTNTRKVSFQQFWTMLHQHVVSVLAGPLGEKEEERIKESLGKEERGLMR